MSNIFAQALGQQANKSVGSLANLQTTVKDNVVNALNENVGAVNTLQKKVKNEISVSEYESYVVNGDWSPALNKIFSMYNDNTSPYYQKRIRVKFDSDITYTIKSKVTINPRWAEIDMRGGKIQTQGMGTNGWLVAIEMNTGDTYANDYNSQKVQMGIYLIGEGKTISGSIGVQYINTAGFKFEGMRVNGFESNIYITDNSYILTWDHCNFSSSVYCIHIPSGKTNYGERLTFIDCNLGNSDYSLRNDNGQGGVHMHNCSYDFTKKGIIKATGGLTFIKDPHMEFKLSEMAESIFQVNGNGTTLTIDGGQLLNVSPDSPVVPFSPYIVEGDGYSCIQGMKMHNLKTTSGQFASDAGVHELIIGNTNNQHGFNFTKVQNSHNAMIDGGFEGTSILDLIWISGDTGTITDRYNSTNLKLELDTVNFKTGTKSLKITKNNAGGSTSRVAVAFPLARFDRRRRTPFMEWQIAKLNALGNGGVINQQFNWMNLSVTSDTLAPKILKQQLISSSDYNVAATTLKDWQKITSTGDNKTVYNPPQWATHLVVQFNLYSYDGATGTAPINLDDFFFEMV